MTKLQPWENTSLDSVKDTHPVLPLIASLLLGVGVLAGTSSAPAAVCSAGLGVSMSISRAMRSAKQYDSIRKYGCYSISLDETLLAEYIRANGLEHTKAEIVWAQEQDLLISEACENLIDGTTEAMPKRLPPQVPIKSTLSPVSDWTDTIHPQPSQSPTISQISPTTGTNPNVTEYIPQSKRGWSIDEMVSEIDNRLILGLKGSGKSVLVGKMLEIVRSKFPDKRIFVIDPKHHSLESDLYKFADEVHSGNIGEMTPVEGLKFVKDGFDKYIKHPEPGLLILDEAIMIGGCMTDNKSNYLESKLRYLVAGGDSRGLNCWLISQSPMLTDLGLKTGVSSQLNLTIITTKHSLPNIKAWSGGSLMNGVVVEDALPAIDACLIPKGRAILSGGFWYPMPVIEVTWNRDDRTMNPVSNPVNPPEPIDIALNPLEPSEPASTPPNQISNQISNPPEPSDRDILERAFKLGSTTEPTLDLALLEFFSCAKNPVPKSVRELRKIRSIASIGASPEQVKERLDYLTSNGKLVQKDKGWILPDWDLN
jgi:hypothetical protein